MSALAFAKYEGLGNDFVVVDVPDDATVGTTEAAWLCDRRTGIGADGVLLVLPPRAPDAVVRMRVINADGSVPEMCGNGLRCIAVHVAVPRRLSEVVVETDAGLRRCTVDGDMVTVDMGVVGTSGLHPLEVDGRHLDLWLADAGNPHAVLFAPGTPEDVQRLGPRIAIHPDFPEGTNVEFATVGKDGVDLVVWERGVGVTMACGTGACAVVAVACERGLLPAGVPVDVRLPGGTLVVTRDAGTGRTTMRGLARRVFSGQLARRMDRR
jgi:diaminopimelate epimerase